MKLRSKFEKDKALARIMKEKKKERRLKQTKSKLKGKK